MRRVLGPAIETIDPADVTGPGAFSGRHLAWARIGWGAARAPNTAPVSNRRVDPLMRNPFGKAQEKTDLSG